MKKSIIYTRSGDDGTTALVSGTRVKKSKERINLYGEADELNSFIGLGISHLPESFDKNFLYKIQSSLFDLGCNLACEAEKRDSFKLPNVTKELVSELENEIDIMDGKLPPLKHFILPGGTLASSAFHVCRTVCRRFERSLVEFKDKNSAEISEIDLMFINRLSDYFFIVARFLNIISNKTEINWDSKK